MEKRVKFQKGMQKKFLMDLKIKLKLSWKELANRLNVNLSSLNKSYLFELCDLPYSLFKRIILIANKEEKDNLNKYKAIVKKQDFVIGRKVLGEQKKIFSEIKITYKKDNLDLDCSKIEYSRYDISKKIKFPTKMSEELAEEMGMHFGDGFLSSYRYDYRLKGNPMDEREYYNNYIKPLYKKLYNLDIFPKEYGYSFGFEIKSKALWQFKSKVLGIKTGDKKDIYIPEALKINDLPILCSFIRGLFDTDGCLYFRSNYGYEKYYPTITLNLASPNLIKNVGEILSMLGFQPKVYFYKDYSTIHLNGINSLKRYEKLIGWRNEKNLKRLQNWKDKWKHQSMAIVV